ncbi:hypothetical protein [Persephonella sp.]
MKENQIFVSELGKEYPDMFAQLFPIMYGITESNVRENLIWTVNSFLAPTQLSKEQYFIYRMTFRLEKLFRQL